MQTHRRNVHLIVEAKKTYVISPTSRDFQAASRPEAGREAKESLRSLWRRVVPVTR